MNIGGKASNEILFINFNQDYRYVQVAYIVLRLMLMHLTLDKNNPIRTIAISTAAYPSGRVMVTKYTTAIHSENATAKVSTLLCHYNASRNSHMLGKADGGIGIVEMLFCTSLVALVGAGEQPAFSPRRLQITNTKVSMFVLRYPPIASPYRKFTYQRMSTICELTFVTAILAVKLNRKRLIVILEEHIYIYDISNMKLLHTLDTSPNPNGRTGVSTMARHPSNRTFLQLFVPYHHRLKTVSWLTLLTHPAVLASYSYSTPLTSKQSISYKLIKHPSAVSASTTMAQW